MDNKSLHVFLKHYFYSTLRQPNRYTVEKAMYYCMLYILYVNELLITVCKNMAYPISFPLCTQLAVHDSRNLIRIPCFWLYMYKGTTIQISWFLHAANSQMYQKSKKNKTFCTKILLNGQNFAEEEVTSAREVFSFQVQQSWHVPALVHTQCWLIKNREANVFAWS